MKYMKILWIIILVADNLLPLLLAHFYPNYKHKEMALSVLGSRQSPVKWIYNVWCILSGVVSVLLRMRCIKNTSVAWQSQYGYYLQYTVSVVRLFRAFVH